MGIGAFPICQHTPLLRADVQFANFLRIVSVYPSHKRRGAAQKNIQH
jgi:hypothetical protein